MNTWTVLKYHDVDEDTNTHLWSEVGTLEGRFTYAAPDVQEVGEKFGVGAYLLLRKSDGTAVKKLTVGMDVPTYIEVETHDPVAA